MPLFTFRFTSNPYLSTLCKGAVLAVLAGVTLVAVSCCRLRRPGPSLAETATAFFFVAVSLACLASPFWPQTIYPWFVLAAGIALFYSARRLAAGGLSAERLAAPLALAALLVSLYSLLQHLGSNPLELISEGERQQSATFVNRNLLAGFLLVPLPLAVTAAVLQKNRSLRLVYFAIFALSLLAFVLSRTRAAWVAAAVQVLLAFFIFRKRREGASRARRRLAHAALLLFALVAAALVVFLLARPPGDFGEQLRNIFNPKHKAYRERWVTWRVGAKLFAHEPIVGWGYGMYRKAGNSWKGPYLEEPANRDLVHLPPYPHNDFVQVAAETGLLGLLPFLVLTGWLLHRTLRPPPDADPLERSIGLAVTGLLAFGLLHFPLSAPATGACFWTLCGWLAGRQARTGPSSEPAKEPARKRLPALAVAASFLLAAVWFKGREAGAYYFFQRALVTLRSGSQELLQKRSTADSTGQPQGEDEYAFLNLWTRALEDYERSARLLPHWGAPLANQVLGWQLKGHFDTALRRLQRATDREPENELIWRALGTYYERERLFVAAREAYQQALSLNPNLQELYRGLARCLAALGELDKAVHTYLELLRFHQQPDVWLDLAELQKSAGRTGDARTSLEHALALTLERHRDGRSHQAARLVRRLLQLNPQASLPPELEQYR